LALLAVMTVSPGHLTSTFPLFSRWLALFVVALGWFTILPATPAEDAVRQADAARIQATTARDVTRLRGLLSDRLSYSQFEGNALTKEQFLAAVVVSPKHYDGYQYDDLNFLEIAPTVVTVTGRATVKATVGKKISAASFRILAVWRQEDAAWKLLAYQSSPLPALPAVSSP
jgi:ketosteroid isomerase-like protein